MPGLRFLLVLLLMIAVLPARAATILRDPDIEHALTQLAAPVLRAAGLSPDRVQILLIEDSTLNAFVTDPDHIFVHTGLLLRLDTPEMFQAVIAHEAAHIANGHLTRRAGDARAARTAAGLGMVLAAAAASAGGGQAAGGIALGVASSAQRVFFGHTREQEASADQASGRYLVRAGIDPAGAVALHEMFRGQDVLAEHRQDPYNRSHPLSADRVRTMRAFAAANGGQQTRSQDVYWYDRARGKLSAFLRAPSWTLRRAHESAPDVRAMREAVAYHRNSNLAKALASMDAAQKGRADDPYLWELRGQILIEARQFGPAVNAYGRAAALAPKNALILAGQGRALLAADRPTEAVKVLDRAWQRDFRNPLLLRDLAQAHARLGNKGLASLATAERYALQGRLQDAGIHAKRAEGLLPRGSADWQRAQDITLAAEQAARQKKRRK